ncbi:MULTISPECIES: thioesterase family protein [unclassified Granulicatella]|uniref:thioesterase family protein n=1 Tax=unclassified Granulicatella TaxID=2630493 RepID=UPI0010745554|nr:MULTISPECIES: thioesterase family protein [unclassified Granulicatella]MBF0781132.1 thioesterase family protein [Granulicatella sp. 19428wC4_WM01]TFU91859.1 diaminopimelate epimerase [Granulicatella sp. WM01]
MFILDKFFQTEPEHSAKACGSGSLEVLSTPCLIAFMENTAFDYCQRQLSKEKTTVGTFIQVEHLAATRIGKTIHIVITHVIENGRQFEFTIEAYDGSILIGRGTHTRAVVNIERFLNKLT